MPSGGRGRKFTPRQIGLADLDARSAPRRGDERSEESTAQRDDRRTTNRQDADSDERAKRVRPKGHAQDARGQLRSEGPSGAAASQSSHPDQFF